MQDTVKESTGNNAKEIVEFSFEKMEQYFGAAKNVIEQYGGDVAELGLMALRIQAASEIIMAIIMFSSVFLLHKLIPDNLWVFAKKYYNDSDYVKNYEIYIPFVIAYIFTGAMSVIGFVALFNIWMWVGIFYPEIYAVHKFIMN